jgi:hypothetical protein
MAKPQRTPENELSSILPLAIVDQHFSRTAGYMSQSLGRGQLSSSSGWGTTNGAGVRGVVRQRRDDARSRGNRRDACYVVWPACQLVFWALN